MMSFDPTLARLTLSQSQAFYRQLTARAALLPGVRSVALTENIPMTLSPAFASIVPEGYQFPKDRDRLVVLSDVVGERYFETAGVPVVSGRGFLETDLPDAPRVAVVNEVLAAKYWPHTDPLGKRFRLGSDWVQIVGVAATVKYQWIAERPREFLYLPLAQHPRAHMTLLVESAGDAAALAEPLRRLVRGIDASQPIYDVRTMDEYYRLREVNPVQAILRTVRDIGVEGLLLAMVGLYGLVSYSVSRRTREFGIRMALGADRGRVLRMVLGQGFMVAAAGIAAGLLLSILAARVVLAGTLTATADPRAVLLVPPILLAVTMLAALAPARRASRVDPLDALRCQ
jgi:predicted permease